jgi:hypothetical protein
MKRFERSRHYVYRPRRIGTGGRIQERYCAWRLLVPIGWLTRGEHSWESCAPPLVLHFRPEPHTVSVSPFPFWSSRLATPNHRCALKKAVTFGYAYHCRN